MILPLWLLLFRGAGSASTNKPKCYARAELIYTCTCTAIIPED